MPYSLIQQVILLPLTLIAITISHAMAESHAEPLFSNSSEQHSSDVISHIERVNRHFNTRFIYLADRDDLWLSREAFVKRGGGDCEDFALAKYQSLMEAGLPAEDFRFVYARQKASGTPHIALIHQPTGKVLDSLTSDTTDMNQRKDLQEEFRFTGSGFYPTKINRLSRAELKTLQQWQAIIRRTEATALKNLAKGSTSP